MKIIDLGTRPKWRVTKEDFENSDLEDLFFMELPSGLILSKVKHVIERYDQGVGRDGRPSVDWRRNGKHESPDKNTKVPNWIDEFNYFSDSEKIQSLFGEDIQLRDFNIRENFEVGEFINNVKFKEGIVLSRIESMIKVLFKDGTIKKLGHNKS